MELKATTRETTGKASRRLRHQGQLPAVVYGHEAASATIQLDAHEFERLFARTGRTQLIDLLVDGESVRKVLVKEVQRSPRRNTFVHVDFHQVSLREKLQVEVPIHIVGHAEPVAAGEADVLQVLHSLRVECLPTEIPDVVEVDVSALDAVDAGVRVAELRLPDGVAPVTDPDELVVKLAARRVVAAEEEGEAAEPQETVAEGESAGGSTEGG